MRLTNIVRLITYLTSEFTDVNVHKSSEKNYLCCMNAVFASPLAPTVAQRRCIDYQALNKIDVNA